LLIALASFTVAASLSGCAPSVEQQCPPTQQVSGDDNICIEEVDYNDFVDEEDNWMTLSINESSGLITKVVGSSGTVMFDEGSGANDIVFSSPFEGHPAYSATVTSTIDIEGTSHTVSAQLAWDYGMHTLDFVVPYYNEFIAGSENHEPIELRQSSIADLVSKSISNEVQSDLASGGIPKFEIVPNGYSIRTTDTRIAELWKAGVPAVQASRTPPVPGYVSDYRYSFACITLGVEFDSTDMLAGLGEHIQIPEGVEKLSWTFLAPSSQLSLATAEPCDATDGNIMEQKDSSKMPPPSTYAPPVQPISPPQPNPSSEDLG